MNGSPLFSRPHTKFSGVIHYIFVEKKFQYKGCMFCNYSSDPECVLEHKFNNHCSLYVVMFCNVFLFGPMTMFYQGTFKPTVIQLLVKQKSMIIGN